MPLKLASPLLIKFAHGRLVKFANLKRLTTVPLSQSAMVYSALKSLAQLKTMSVFAVSISA